MLKMSFSSLLPRERICLFLFSLHVRTFFLSDTFCSLQVEESDQFHSEDWVRVGTDLVTDPQGLLTSRISCLYMCVAFCLEMVARTVKQLLRQRLRETHCSPPSIQTTRIRVCEFLNEITYARRNMWANIAKQLRARFGTVALKQGESTKLYSMVVIANGLFRVSS